MDDVIKKRNPNAIIFIFFHELGHSLLRLWNQPLWDNEDAADEFATAVLLFGKAQGEEFALAGANYYASLSSFNALVTKLITRGSRHSIPKERARNIQNWIANSTEEKRRWLNLFIPHMQTKELKDALSTAEPWIDTQMIEKELKARGEK